MTYCVAIKVQQGLVFASDSRSSAGVDDVRCHSKLHLFELGPDRVFVVLTAGNLGTTQSVLEQLRRDLRNPEAPQSLQSVGSVFDAAEYLGRVSVKAQKSVVPELESEAVKLEATFIIGGQVRGEAPALFLVYPIGNSIETSPATPFLQIGESKYGKPILDRIIRDTTSLEDAARCALVSMDSTLRSNISVGPPIDLLTLPVDALQVGARLRLDLETPYYRLLKDAWSRELDQAFSRLPRFDWELGADSISPARPELQK